MIIFAVNIYVREKYRAVDFKESWQDIPHVQLGVR